MRGFQATCTSCEGGTTCTFDGFVLSALHSSRSPKSVSTLPLSTYVVPRN